MEEHSRGFSREREKRGDRLKVKHYENYIFGSFSDMMHYIEKIKDRYRKLSKWGKKCNS